MGISWTELGKAWRAAGGDKLFSSLNKKELNQLKSNIQGSDLEDLGGDLTKYISGLSESFNATTAAQRDIFAANRNAHMFSGIPEDKLNSIHSANEERVLRTIDPEGYAARRQKLVTESLQNSLESNRNEYYKRKAETQKNIQQDNFIRRLEGQRQYFENSRYSTSAEAATQANIEEASQRGINKQLTGSQKEVGVSGNTAAAREEAGLRNGNSPEAQKLQQIFREREAAEAAAQRNVEQARSIGKQQLQKYQDFRNQQQTVNGSTAAAANVEKSSFRTRYQQLKDQEDFARNQFASTSMLSKVADEYGIKKNAAGLRDVKKIIEDRKQGVLGVGSEKPLQEGTLTYKPQALSDMKPEEWSEMERKTGISDLGFSSKSVSSDNGMPIATTTRELSIDEAILRGHIKQNDMPGTKAANDMFYGRIEKGLKSQHASIMKSDLSQEEKRKKWDTAREEAIERLRNGATFQDYFFGNRVHHGLAGMAAITGTLGVAFGGHKSNAELYSSPF